MILFISDVHLSDDTPEITAQLINFLNDEAQGADALYILGDLFETWVGDDDPTTLRVPVTSALKQLSESGTPCYFMHGNRDFVIGEQFCTEAGLTLLPDPSIVDLYGQPVLLAHGDAYCTDDAEYQLFRTQSRDPAWQQMMLAKPLEERLAIAAAGRQQSLEHQSNLASNITDVNHEVIANAFTEANVSILIHGHTHRPAIHERDTETGKQTRIVLGDWHEQGSVLKWHKKEFELVTLARV